MRKLLVFVSISMMLVTLVIGAFSESADVGGMDDVSPEMEVEMMEGTDMEDADVEDAEPIEPTPSPEPTRPPVVNHDFSMEISLGYDGLMMFARWTPLFIDVTNNGPDFDGLVGVNVFLSQTQYDRYETPLTLAGGATKRVVLPIKPQARQDVYAIELTEKGEIIAETRVKPSRVVAPEAMVIGVLSAEAEAISYMNQRANGLDTLRGEVWVTIPLATEVFPETVDLMSAYTMLVVDGVDVRTLSETQQNALSAWLVKGGVVFVSGGAKAAASYPFFSQWTGLTAGKLEEAEDITPALIRYMTTSAKPVEESVWLSGMPEKGSLVATETQGLVQLKRAGDGLIYTVAFDMGDKSLSKWSAMSSFWPRLLRQSAPNDYVSLINRAEQNRYSNESWYAQALVSTLRIDNPESGIPVLLLLAAYLFVVGFGGYIALKKFDRREWLWGVVPAVSVAFALILLLMSGNSSMNEPVALTASRVFVMDDDVQATTFIGVATPVEGEMEIETNQPQLPDIIHEDYYGYYDSGQTDTLYRPVDMRQRMQFGLRPKVGFTSNASWDPKMLKVDNVDVDMGALEARLWMEQDGVHGEAVNGTDLLLKNCFVVTSFGFCHLGDLLPGQTVELAMLLPEKPIDYSSPSFAFKPNIMYTSLDVDQPNNANYVNNNNVYSYLQGAVYDQFEDKYENPEAQRMNALVQTYESMLEYYNTNAMYYFFGFNDTLGQVAVQLNGKPISRTAHTAAIATKMEYEPIGPTGVVMFHQGLIPAQVVVDMGENEKPRMPTEEDSEVDDANNTYLSNDTYLNIGAPVALRFALPEMERYKIEKMTLAGWVYESMPTLYLYNNSTKTWDAQSFLVVSMSGEEWTPYIDAGGMLYVRIVPSDTSNRYDGMSMPTIALKGEVK